MFDFMKVTEVELEPTLIDTSNWQRVFLDLEGSLTTDGDILQLATITTDWNFNITNAFSSYYKNSVPIAEEEFKVHGISEDFLSTNSTDHFSNLAHLSPLYSDKPTMFISYTTFDIVRITEELNKYRKALVDFGPEKPDLSTNLSVSGNCHFNAFSHGKSKGTKLAKDLGENVFKSIYSELSRFGNFKMKGNHDALYDTVMILALCRRIAHERTGETNI